MRRIWVVGTSGSGKSTLARRLSARTGAPWIQLDALYHQPNWTPLPRSAFRSTVRALVAEASWIVDGNYLGAVGDLVRDHADTVVWLDLPRRVVMRQIIGRTLRRILTAEELWNGNRERPRNFFSLDKERSVIVWAWTTHGENRARFQAALADPAYRRIRFVRLRSRRQVADFLAASPPARTARSVSPVSRECRSRGNS